jgi:hypothetical protein
MERARITKDVREWARMVSLSERHRLGLPPATEKRSVHMVLIRGPGQKLLDDDNAIAALKVARDALQCDTARHLGAGWIVDDSERWAKVTYGPQRGGSAPAVEVTVTDAA